MQTKKLYIAQIDGDGTFSTTIVGVFSTPELARRASEKQYSGFYVELIEVTLDEPTELNIFHNLIVSGK